MQNVHLRWTLVPLLFACLLGNCASPSRSARDPSSARSLFSPGNAGEASADPERRAAEGDEIGRVLEEAEDVSFLTDLSTPEGQTDGRQWIAIEENDRVDYFLRLFTGPQRGWVEKALQRSGRYRDRIWEIFREEGLPEDLVYLALIESGYNPHAYSRSGAVGIWQFMEATGRRYGLTIDWWVDERRDLEKSTRAAALYLKDLYTLFEDWHLAAAAYNAGEGKLQRGLERYNTNNFWDLSQKRYLKDETRNYVPKFLAVLAIARDPDRYGFGNLRYEPPLAYESVPIRYPLDLGVVARACGNDLEAVKRLNPQLSRGCTPPHYRGAYEIKVPRGTGEAFLAYCENLTPEERLTFVRHRIQRGETLSQIARRYNVPVHAVMEMNRIASRHRIRQGETLVVPVSALYASRAATGKAPPAPARAGGSGAARTCRVQKGDSLWKIGLRHGVSVESLLAWNQLTPTSKILPGQRLVVADPGRPSGGAGRMDPAGRRSGQGAAGGQPGERIVHRVQAGESVWSIAKRHGVSVDALTAWNRLPAPSEIRAGQTLVIWKDAAPARTSAGPREAGRQTPDTFLYTVQQGDTLWEIARRHDVTLAELCQCNGIDIHHPIRPGLRLAVPVKSHSRHQGGEMVADNRPEQETP